MITYEASERPRSKARKPLSLFQYTLILGGLTALGPPLSIDMYLPAMPSMIDDLQTSDSLLQLTLATFVIGLAVGQLIIGPISDMVGRRKPLMVGFGVYVVASFACAASVSVEMLLAMRVVQSLGAAACLITVRAMVRDLFDGKTMTKFFSMLMLVTGLAPVIAPILGSQILRIASWRWIFVALGVFGVLLLIVVAIALPESLPAERRRPARIGASLKTYGKLLNNRVFLGYALTSGLVVVGLFAYLAGSSFVLQDLHGLTPQAYSLVFAGNAIAMICGGQVNRKLVDRHSEKTLSAIGVSIYLAAGLSMLAVALFKLDLWLLLGALLTILFSIGLTLPNMLSLALANYPDNAGAAGALIGMVHFVLGGAVAPLMGLGGEKASDITLGIALAASGLVALLAFVTLVHKRRVVREAK